MCPMPASWLSPVSLEVDELTLKRDLNRDLIDVPARLSRFSRFSLFAPCSVEVFRLLLLKFLRRRRVTAESEHVEVFKALLSLPTT